MTGGTPPPAEVRARRPGLPIRVRLTLSYAVFVVVVGVTFVVVGYLLLRFVPEGNLVDLDGGIAPNRSALLDVFVKYTSWALLLLAALGLGGGWILAGHMLRPLTRITDAARLARDGSLEHRIRLAGRQDEFADLADTVDEMLARLQLAFEEHRRFAANASHELRTPHAVIRTMLEVDRSGPRERDVDLLLSRIDEMNERSIVLTEALLSLSDAEHHQERLAELALAPVASAVVDELADTAARARVGLSARLEEGAVIGDPELLRQLVANLVQNAIVHNHADGWVRVSATTDGGGAMVLEVENTGERIDEATLATFTEPFTRGAGRTRRADARHVGSGLGLAIVASIARVHGATLGLSPREGGGLRVRVAFPPLSASR
jgi:two-component system sensor histidine kinase VanS